MIVVLGFHDCILWLSFAKMENALLNLTSQTSANSNVYFTVDGGKLTKFHVMIPSDLVRYFGQYLTRFLQ